MSNDISKETPEAALNRIQNGQFGNNDAAAIMAFSAAGVPAEHITPRVNVLTFKAWRAKGRQVAKFASSVGVVTWIPASKKGKKQVDGEGRTKLFPKTVGLFHESQTIPTDASWKDTRPAAWNNANLIKPEGIEHYGSLGEPTEQPQDYDFEANTARIKETYQVETIDDLGGTVEEWNEGTPIETIEREMAAAITAPDQSSVEAIEATAKNCTCPMAGVVNDIDCPEHGEREPVIQIREHSAGPVVAEIPARKADGLLF